MSKATYYQTVAILNFQSPIRIETTLVYASALDAALKTFGLKLEPTLLPEPDKMPPNFPRVILNDEQKGVNIVSTLQQLSIRCREDAEVTSKLEKLESEELAKKIVERILDIAEIFPLTEKFQLQGYAFYTPPDTKKEEVAKIVNKYLATPTKDPTSFTLRYENKENGFIKLWGINSAFRKDANENVVRLQISFAKTKDIQPQGYKPAEIVGAIKDIDLVKEIKDGVKQLD